MFLIEIKSAPAFLWGQNKPNSATKVIMIKADIQRFSSFISLILIYPLKLWGKIIKTNKI
jgi:hypothetical protein